MNSSGHYKYLHIDSRHRNQQQSKSNFTVQIPHGLDNISRVCVKSFSIPNSFGNMGGNLNRLYWVEFFHNGNVGALWRYKIFYIKLDELIIANKYSDNVNLKNFINSQFVNTQSTIYNAADNSISNHKFEEEDALNITASYDEITFKFKFNNATSSKRKLFAPYIVNYKGSLWENMGFDLTKCFKEDFEIDGTIDDLNVNVKADYAKLDSYGLFREYSATDAASTNSSRKFIEGDTVSTHENHLQRLYICSNTLVSDSLVVKKTIGLATNILEEIVNDVAKFSYIHKEMSGVPMWNRVLNPRIKTFDIQLIDDKDSIIKDDDMPDYFLTLMFEVIDEVEYNAVDIEKYMQAAFKLGHPTNK